MVIRWIHLGNLRNHCHHYQAPRSRAREGGCFTDVFIGKFSNADPRIVRILHHIISF